MYQKNEGKFLKHLDFFDFRLNHRRGYIYSIIFHPTWI